MRFPEVKYSLSVHKNMSRKENHLNCPNIIALLLLFLIYQPGFQSQWLVWLSEQQLPALHVLLICITALSSVFKTSLMSKKKTIQKNPNNSYENGAVFTHQPCTACQGGKYNTGVYVCFSSPNPPYSFLSARCKTAACSQGLFC